MQQIERVIENDVLLQHHARFARGRSLKGQRNHQAQLTERETSELRQLIAEHGLVWGDLSFIARGYGVTASSVHQLLNGKTW